MTVATVTASQPAAVAVTARTSLEDLEAAVLGHSCPTPETTAVLHNDPAEANSAAAILREANASGSPLISALYDTYWTARDGVPRSTNTYDLADFAQCFVDGFDVSRYQEQIEYAVGSIDGIDRQVQDLVDNGSATIDGAVHTVEELSEPVVALAQERADETSQVALALLLELATQASMLQYTSHGSPGLDLEAGARPEINDPHVAALDATEAVVESLRPVAPGPLPEGCRFRQTQNGDREGGTGEHIFVLTNDPSLGVKRDLYRLVTHRSTYLYNVERKCMKFPDMPDGDFEFEDRTPFPDNLLCGWRILEPYGYRKFYEFVPGYPQSGYMMRNIYDVAYECDTLVVPIFKMRWDRDCPFNNVYAHYDNKRSWYTGEGTSVCH